MSASESICAPNGLATPSLRASAPSRPSKATQATRQTAAMRTSPCMARKMASRPSPRLASVQRVDQRELGPPGHRALAGQQRDASSRRRARRRRRRERAGLIGAIAWSSASVGGRTAVSGSGCRRIGHGRAGARLVPAPAHPHQQDLPGEGAAAAQPAGPTTPGGTRTVRRTTPAPRGSRHVFLHHVIDDRRRVGWWRHTFERPCESAAYTIAQDDSGWR